MAWAQQEQEVDQGLVFEQGGTGSPQPTANAPWQRKMSLTEIKECAQRVCVCEKVRTLGCVPGGFPYRPDDLCDVTASGMSGIRL